MKVILWFAVLLTGLAFGQATLVRDFRGAYESISGAAITNDFAHWKRHQGQSFETYDTLTLGSGDSAQFAFTAPVGQYIHIVFEVTSNAAATVGFYKDVPRDSITAPDTIVAHNVNFNAATQASTAVITWGPSEIKDYGTHLFSEHFGTAGLPSGAGRVGGRARGEGEFILVPGRTYMIDVRSGAAGNKVNVGCSFYY